MLAKLFFSFCWGYAIAMRFLKWHVIEKLRANWKFYLLVLKTVFCYCTTLWVHHIFSYILLILQRKLLTSEKFHKRFLNYIWRCHWANLKTVALSVQPWYRKGRVLRPLKFNNKTISITGCSRTLFLWSFSNRNNDPAHETLPKLPSTPQKKTGLCM